MTCYTGLCRKAFFHKPKEEEQGENSANAVIRREYAKLGPITSVLCLFDGIQYGQKSKAPSFLS